MYWEVVMLKYFSFTVFLFCSGCASGFISGGNYHNSLFDYTENNDFQDDLNHIYHLEYLHSLLLIEALKNDPNIKYDDLSSLRKKAYIYSHDFP